MHIKCDIASLFDVWRYSKTARLQCVLYLTTCVVCCWCCTYIRTASTTRKAKSAVSVFVDSMVMLVLAQSMTVNLVSVLLQLHPTSEYMYVTSPHSTGYTAGCAPVLFCKLALSTFRGSVQHVWGLVRIVTRILLEISFAFQHWIFLKIGWHLTEL